MQILVVNGKLKDGSIIIKLGQYLEHTSSHYENPLLIQFRFIFDYIKRHLNYSIFKHTYFEYRHNNSNNTETNQHFLKLSFLQPVFLMNRIKNLIYAINFLI